MMKASECAQESNEKTRQCSCGSFLVNAGSSHHETISISQSHQLRALEERDESTIRSNQVFSSSLKYMDASFVQVPGSVDLSSVDATNFQPSSGRSAHHVTTPVVASLSHKEDCEFAVLHQPFKCSSYGYVHSASKLFQAATSLTDVPALCRRCIHRVERALENDSDRLLAEAVVYEQTIQQDKANTKGFQHIVQLAVKNALQGIDGEEVVASDLVQTPCRNSISVQNSIEEAFENEIESLEQACQQQRDELIYLRAVQKEQALLFEEIEQINDSMAAEQNALELEGRAFDNDQEHLTKMLSEYHNEMERLSAPAVRLPATLIHLHVDIERGLRYPLINELRLAFRPKGDVQWKEIQAAWALASNLLLMVATIFNFQSHNWKIVPLSHCAKLIYSPSKRTDATCDGSDQNRSTKEGKNQVIVFNLGHPKTDGSKALLMWNALLFQVIQHAVTKNSLAVESGIYDSVAVPPVPFDISSTSIGGISLAQLGESDDIRWSRVIHFMASNLLWLSKCASSFISHRVLFFSPLSNTTPEGENAA